MTLLEGLFYLYVVVVLIQVLFYTIVFGQFSFLKPQKRSSKKIAVSVIICAKNEAENLMRFLPSIIDQNYPDFEIVLINDASSDNTLEVMHHFAEQNSNIKVVDVANNEAFWSNKKYALTLGIKAAKHNFLLFTDADCKPVTEHWISNMSACLSNNKSIVLGYGAYAKIKNSLLNKLIRFETLVAATSYFSMAKIGMPYMGVGRNLFYSKYEFLNANGFVNHIKIKSGDDDLFVNQVATRENTAICINEDSFTISIPETSFIGWFKQKRRHVSTSTYYKVKHKFVLGLFFLSQLLFWLLAVTLLAITFNWQIVLCLVIIRLTIQYVVLGRSANKLQEKDLVISIPFLEVFLILSQLAIFIANMFSKPKHWK